MLVLLEGILPHHVEDGSRDEAVLDGAREEEGGRVGQQFAHDIAAEARRGQNFIVVRGYPVGFDLSGRSRS